MPDATPSVLAHLVAWFFGLFEQSRVAYSRLTFIGVIIGVISVVVFTVSSGVYWYQIAWTKPRIVLLDCDEYPRSKPEHRVEFYEVRNPGPGTLDDLSVKVLLDYKLDEATKQCVVGSIHIFSVDDNLNFTRMSVGENRTQATGIYKRELKAGRSFFFKLSGPMATWKKPSVSVNTPHGEIYRVDEPDELRGPLITIMFMWAGLFVSAITGTVFAYLYGRLRRDSNAGIDARIAMIAETVNTPTETAADDLAEASRNVNSLD